MPRFTEEPARTSWRASFCQVVRWRDHRQATNEDPPGLRRRALPGVAHRRAARVAGRSRSAPPLGLLEGMDYRVAARRRVDGARPQLRKWTLNAAAGKSSRHFPWIRSSAASRPISSADLAAL